jgi:hypothetical protein
MTKRPHPMKDEGYVRGKGEAPPLYFGLNGDRVNVAHTYRMRKFVRNVRNNGRRVSRRPNNQFIDWMC